MATPGTHDRIYCGPPLKQVTDAQAVDFTARNFHSATQKPGWRLDRHKILSIKATIASRRDLVTTNPVVIYASRGLN